jgi:hypothetical protein
VAGAFTTARLMMAAGGWSLKARSRIGLVATTFGLVVAGLGTALALNAPAATPPTTGTLPRFTQLSPATMSPSTAPTAPPTTPPSAADATSVPIAAPAVVAHTVHHTQAPAARPKAVPAPADAPAPAPQHDDATSPTVEVAHHQSVRDDLRALRERIRARVDQHLERRKARLDG